MNHAHCSFSLFVFSAPIGVHPRLAVFLDTLRQTVAPDKRIEPTWEEFHAGRDPIMEWVLSYTR